MDHALIVNWNERVAPDDLVYHLGDLVGPHWSRDALAPLLAQLNGRKRLVLGNRDGEEVATYRAAGFEEVYATGTWLEGLWLSHMPQQQVRRGDFNVHGHVHHDSRGLDPQRYRCVSVEQTRYAPMLLDNLLAERAFRLTQRVAHGD